MKPSAEATTFDKIKRRAPFRFMGQPYIKVNDYSAKDPRQPEHRYKFSAEMIVYPMPREGEPSEYHQRNR